MDSIKVKTVFNIMNFMCCIRLLNLCEHYSLRKNIFDRQDIRERPTRTNGLLSAAADAEDNICSLIINPIKLRAGYQPELKLNKDFANCSSVPALPLGLLYAFLFRVTITIIFFFSSFFFCEFVHKPTSRHKRIIAVQCNNTYHKFKSYAGFF